MNKDFYVTSIGRYAFSSCSGLTSLIIGNSITEISNSAFEECRGIKHLIWNAKKCQSMGDMPTSNIETIVIGDEVETLPFDFISGSKITSVTIPDSVTEIGGGAFEGCRGLTSVTIPDSVIKIGGGAFKECRGLTSVTIHNSVTEIGDHAFKGCRGLTSVTIPNSVTKIGYCAFADCSGLTSLIIGNSVTEIGDSAFLGCRGIKHLIWNAKKCQSMGDMPTSNIETIVIGDEVRILPSYFAYGSKITSVTIPNSVTEIGEGAFRKCGGLKSIVVASGNSRYDTRDNCNAVIKTSTNTLITGCKTTTIPNSVTKIGDYAFEGCSGLTSVAIPNSITEIGKCAFIGCSSLTSIVVASGNAKYDSREDCNAIIVTATNTLIAGCKTTTIPNSVTTIKS